MIEITEFPKIPNKIINAVNTNDLVIFIGAGMSYKLGCSTWKTLANELIDLCESKGYMNNFEASQLKHMDNKKVITICHNILISNKKKDLFLKQMKKSFNDENVKEDNPKLDTYKNLYKLGGVFITTNADRHIDKIFLSEQNIIVDSFDNDTDIKNKNLYKIHGSIAKPSSLVFTVKQYLKQYTDNQFGLFLKKLFKKTILFVGYGLEEFELLEYMYKNIKDEQETGNKKYFFLKDFYKHEKKIAEFEQLYFNELGIELIPYAKDELGFRQLDNIIEKWVNDIKDASMTISNSFNEIDEVLRNPK